MYKNRTSSTADAAAAVRANHFLHDGSLIFRDPISVRMLNAKWRLILRNRFLHRIIVRGLLAGLRPVHGLILARSRYAEDALAASAQKGNLQYVIVGAGLDTYAARSHTGSGVKVFELDHPASQAEKIRRLAQSVGIPGNVEFVPADFEVASISEVLAASSLRLEEPAFFSWLGNSFYLTPSAVGDVMQAIATISCPGSELVMDYMGPEEVLPVNQRRPLRLTKRFAERRGEPLLSFFEPDQLLAMAKSFGFETVANLNSADLSERYFNDRADNLVAMPGAHIAHFRIGQQEGGVA